MMGYLWHDNGPWQDARGEGKGESRTEGLFFIILHRCIVARYVDYNSKP